MRRGGDDTVRVDKGAGSPAPEQARSSVDLAKVSALLLLGVALVLVAVAVYFVVSGVGVLASSCWEGRSYPGCQQTGVERSVKPLLVAQVLGGVGLVMLVQVLRRLRGARRVRSGMVPGSMPLVWSHVRFWLDGVVAAVFVVAGIGSLLSGLLGLSFACSPDPYCVVEEARSGMIFVVLGEVLVIEGVVVARRVFRRRPWRRDARGEQSET